MPSTLKTLDPTQVELEISITPEEFGAAQDAAFRKLSRNAKVPGFRPGKVPRKIFESQYGTGAIVDRALDDLIPGKIDAAVEEHGLEPLGDPQRGAAARGRRPAAAGQGGRRGAPADRARGLHRHRDPRPARAGQRRASVEPALEQHAPQRRRRCVPVDRPVQLGDVATLDYEGKIDGVPFEGGTAQGQETEIRQERFIPGFVDGIVGMTAGETKDVTRALPRRLRPTGARRQGRRLHDHRARGQGARAARARRRVRQARLAQPERWTSCGPTSSAGSTSRSSRTRAAASRPRCSRSSSRPTTSRCPRCWSSARSTGCWTSRASTSTRAGRHVGRLHRQQRQDRGRSCASSSARRPGGG